MAIRNGYYIVEPTPKLVELVTKYDETNLARTVIWELPESSDIHQNIGNTFVGYIKVTFLANIIAMYEYLKTRQRFHSYEKIIHEIFGNPPSYDINLLDDWWTFERADALKEFSYEISQSSADTLRQIQKTNDIFIDTWLTSIIDKKDNTKS